MQVPAHVGPCRGTELPPQVTATTCRVPFARLSARYTRALHAAADARVNDTPTGLHCRLQRDNTDNVRAAQRQILRSYSRHGNKSHNTRRAVVFEEKLAPAALLLAHHQSVVWCHRARHTVREKCWRIISSH